MCHVLNKLSGCSGATPAAGSCSGGDAKQLQSLPGCWMSLFDTLNVKTLMFSPDSDLWNLTRGGYWSCQLQPNHHTARADH